MCGIAVAINWPDAQKTVRGMIPGILHRGDMTDPVVSPNDWTAMCTRRLRIVDPQHGAQPKASFDGKILVSFNGEIYNHRELRRELEELGISFQTDSDTEVLANALRAWGASALTRLNGMYAFVALDMGNGEFLAARDPFGVKPLYVIEQEGGFLFCSEMAPLLAATAASDVMLLPPGYLLTKSTCTRFYTLAPAQTPAPPSPQELDRILDEAVRSRLPREQGFAALFSGGIDSTLLVHYARRYQPDLPAYFIGGADAPDREFAALYAQQTGLNLVQVDSPPDGPATLSLLETIAAAVETFEPGAVRPALYTYQISQRIHQDGYRVAMCGEGADELFAGYAPMERAFAMGEDIGRDVQDQCLGLMHRVNLQRVDRCGMRFALEIREPFLDTRLAEYARQLGPDILLKDIAGIPIGKQPLRAIYDLYPGQLPVRIRDRTKVAFGEGAGIALDSKSWAGMFEDAITDREFQDGLRQFRDFHVTTKEELFYLRALAARLDVSRIPHLKARAAIDLPSATPVKTAIASS